MLNQTIFNPEQVSNSPSQKQVTDPMLCVAVSSRQGIPAGIPSGSKYLLVTKWLWLAWGLCCKVCNVCWSTFTQYCTPPGQVCSLTWVGSWTPVWQLGLWPSGPQGWVCGCTIRCHGSVPSFQATRGVNTRKSLVTESCICLLRAVDHGRKTEFQNFFIVTLTPR